MLAFLKLVCVSPLLRCYADTDGIPNQVGNQVKHTWRELNSESIRDYTECQWILKVVAYFDVAYRAL